MTDLLLYIVLGLQGLALLVMLVLWRRQGSSSHTSDGLYKGQERLEVLVREEMAGNRRESGEQARAAREEAGVSTLKLVEQFGALQRDNLAFREGLNERLKENLGALGTDVVRQIEVAGGANTDEAAQLRAELSKVFNGFGSALVRQLGEATTAQDRRFEQFEKRLVLVGERTAGQIHSLDDAVTEQIEKMADEVGRNWDAKHAQDDETTRAARLELHEALGHLTEAVAKNFAAAGEMQRGQFDSFATRVNALSESADKRAEVLRGTVDNRLQLLQKDNADKLEEMRRTVDEKLQGTLNDRLGESFRLVSERLELVHEGLGEMRTLANGVGDLKKVLSSVKTRGNWGEIQLGHLLDQMLTPQQYEANIATIPGSEQRADFAIRLPGQSENREEIWLPIDASFPQENYERLLEAHNGSDASEIEQLSQQLEAQIKESARQIGGKYVRAPHTTDFAILFLPTEGLYAEVIRRTGLMEVLQQEYRVTVAGPTTLAALLNALQMGFRTLAIQERTREVWGTLSVVKTEFRKYGEVLDAVQKKLQEASDKIEDTRAQSRALENQLREVEVPAKDAAPALPFFEASADLSSNGNGHRNGNGNGSHHSIEREADEMTEISGQ